MKYISSVYSRSRRNVSFYCVSVVCRLFLTQNVLSYNSPWYLSHLNGCIDWVEPSQTGHLTQQEVDLLGHVTQLNPIYLLGCGFWSELFFDGWCCIEWWQKKCVFQLHFSEYLGYLQQSSSLCVPLWFSSWTFMVI